MPLATLYVDSNILIYLLEETAFTRQTADRIADFLETGGGLVTSTVTIAELIAGAVHDASLTLNRMSMLKIIPVDAAIAEQAGALRQKHTIKPLDAFQLATAILSGTGKLFTNDRPLAVIAGHYIPVIGL